MKWSKGWFALIAIVAAACAAAAILVPGLLQREVDKQVQLRLSSAVHGADALLKLHARRWLDVTAQAAGDGTLGEALDAATHNASNLELLHKTAQERLRTWNGEWKAAQVIAVDARSRVVARASTTAVDEEVWKDDLSSAKIVGEALRGYKLDDAWMVSGKVMRVTAAPVVVRERYAGALLILTDLGAEVTGELREMLGTDLALVGGAKVVARSGNLPILDGAPAVLKEQAATLAKSGVTEPLPLGADGAYGIAAVAIPGTASRDIAFVLATERPRLITPEALLARLDPTQLPWTELAPVGGALVAALLLGLFLMGREHDAPLERLLSAVQSTARGDTQRVDDKPFAGRLGTIARTINTAIDRAVRSISPRGSMPEAGSGPISMRNASDHGVGLSLDGQASYAPPPPMPPGANAPPTVEFDAASAADASYGTSSYGTSSYGSSSYAPPASSFGPPGSSARPPTSFPAVATHSPSPPPAASGGAPSPAMARPAARYEPLDPPLPASGDASGLRRAPVMNAPSSGSNLLASLDEISGVHEIDPNPRRSSYAPPGGDVGGASDGFRADDPLRFGGSQVPPDLLAPPEPTPPLDPIEAEFQSVYQDFIDTRQRCGEATDGVTFDKFAVRLRTNREQLMSRYACKGVKFQVYVKDGKAALKATPVN